MTREEIEQKMDELAREYHDTHDPEIPKGDGPLKGNSKISIQRCFIGAWD